MGEKIIPTRYLREQGCEDPLLFSKPKAIREQKRLGNTALDDGEVHESSNRRCSVTFVQQLRVIGVSKKCSNIETDILCSVVRCAPVFGSRRIMIDIPLTR
jgi:hypothetical protein